MVLVDSSVWIEAARQTGDLSFKVGLEALLEEYEATLCSPVLLEVLGGARREDRRRLEMALNVLPFVPVTESTWNLAREHAWRYRDMGLVIPWNDILVGTLSLEHGCRVYARDRHFDQMAGVLGLRLYQAGYGGAYAADPPPP